ncbi:MAG: hypothetical protein CM1200mP2_49420 [Planctomycetaceae bacterium]|nr:MAG: hypothetical protein CM1200mP2_49420 [Planctomycetaceae bacterium]
MQHRFRQPLGLSFLVGSMSENTEGANRVAQLLPRAKRMIFLFMKGGPSQMDTFDPKPRVAERPRQTAADRSPQAVVPLDR